MNTKKTILIFILFIVAIILIINNIKKEEEITYGKEISITELFSEDYKEFIHDKIYNLIEKCNCNELNDFKSLSNEYSYNFIYEVTSDTVLNNLITYQINTNLFNDYVKDHLVTEISGRIYSSTSTEFKNYYLSLWNEEQVEYEPYEAGIGLTEFYFSPEDLTYKDSIYTYILDVGLANEDISSYNFDNNLEGEIKFKYINNTYTLISFVIKEK